MGDMADDLRHNEIMREIKKEDYSCGRFFFTSPKPKREKVYWVNGRNGEKIEIKDMETSHIINSLKKCKRQNWRVEAIPYLEAELKRRLRQCQQEAHDNAIECIRQSSSPCVIEASELAMEDFSSNEAYLEALADKDN